MSAENCIDTTRCPCPCLPKVTLEQAVVDLVESIALQENALSHILCAESRKMDAAMKLDGLDGYDRISQYPISTLMTMPA